MAWFLIVTRAEVEATVDTQAAHLERSRTKAAIQRLAMRVHYQRLGASGTTAGMVGKPRRIGDFFPTPLTANVTR